VYSRSSRNETALVKGVEQPFMMLEGVRILLVEDEGLVAMSIEDMLADLGCQVTASAHTIDIAIDKAREGGFQCALLDVNLRGKEVFPVAEILCEQGIPFVFLSGYGRAALPEKFRARPVAAKPFQSEELAAALSAALAESPAARASE
jgi:CheY-like chemotaxis protein